MHGQTPKSSKVTVTASPPRAARSPRPTVLLLEKVLLLGDAIVRVPAYRALRAAFPKHRIIGLSPYNSAFTTVLSQVSHLFVDDWQINDAIIAGPKKQREFAKTFGPIDVVLDFRANPRSFASFAAFAPVANRYIANGLGFVLRKGIPLGFEARPSHNAARYHRMAELIAGRRLPYDFRLPGLPEAEKHAARLLPKTQRFFGIAGGPDSKSKTWPRDRQVVVAEKIVSLGLRPVILLGVDEADQREWYETNIPDALVVDLKTAKGDPAYLFWLLQAVAGRLTGCVASENGLGHLVASRGIPLLTLAGPTDPFVWRPVTPLWWLLRAQDYGMEAVWAIPPVAINEAIAEIVKWTERDEQVRPLKKSKS